MTPFQFLTPHCLGALYSGLVTFMDKRLMVAAAQLGKIPDEFTKGICAKEINALLLRGSRCEKRQAEKLLEEIAVNEIRKYSVSRMTRLMREAAEHGCDLIVFPELALTS